MRNLVLLVCLLSWHCVAFEVDDKDKEVPPFSYSLDQSIPCPLGCGQDFYLSDVSDAAMRNVSRSKEVQDVLGNVSGFLRDMAKEKLGSPSAGIVATLNGKPLLSSYYGVSRLDDAASPLNDSSVFMIASITKTFVTATLFHMRDRGLVTLDDPVSLYLPDFRIRPPPSSRLPSHKKITLKSLAMQVSGLPREIPPYVNGATREETERNVLESIAANLTQMSEMYASPHYSNLGLALLGRALEKASPHNVTWEDYLRTEILEPLGMFDTGNPSDLRRRPQVRARIIDGVAEPNGSTPVPISEENTWGGPCGAMHSSFRDMSIWANFIMDSPGSDRERFARVLDPTTRAEMRNTGYIMGDGLSAVTSGVLESAFVSERWVINKLGCVNGYRSDLTLVPSLGLTVFGVATSTCDMYGDGDAVVFPVLHRLIRAVRVALEDVPTRPLPSSDITENVVGSYCDGRTVVQIENGTQLVARGDPYSFALDFVDAPNASVSTWRMIMGPEAWLSQTTTGCAAPKAYPESHGLCSVSCWRKMARGSGAIAHFRKSDTTGVVTMEVPGTGEYCVRDE